MAVAQIGSLTTFVAGTQAVASELNTNLTSIRTAFNNLVTGSNTLNIDTISEVTSANGVVIDGVTLKDGGATLTAALALGSGTITTTGAVATGALATGGDIIISKASPALLKVAETSGAGNAGFHITESGDTGFEIIYNGTSNELEITGGTSGTFNVTAATIDRATGNWDFSDNTLTTTGTLTAGIGASSFTGTDQTGIAVSAAGIHAALVNLGLITA